MINVPCLEVWLWFIHAPFLSLISLTFNLFGGCLLIILSMLLLLFTPISKEIAFGTATYVMKNLHKQVIFVLEIDML